ncbi:MAG: bifunctional phosphoribosyl-AMP cyclohydrolase/phosphoribosyl-ATP diphosphatase HisIE [Bacteroidetes bacterium]|nr:MAG: bifunctional phosphoribosyl-AMP cyclohydrolase/phosphoribosyl-ATP diphosphatase HisIE [Bacteroidota bacterium]
MNIDFTKGNGLVPVIVQDTTTLQVLMLGYMNAEALQLTIETKKVTFFSRSKNRLWMKGESSGNTLELIDLRYDCDQDSILALVKPKGPTCHKGTTSCFGEKETKGFIYQLEATIDQRISENAVDSYTNQLYRKGINKVAQKVGEEAVELVIEAMDNNDVLFKNEAADLLYHYLILLRAKGYRLEDIEAVLMDRR